jgi:cytosine/adenosine deaminase-related metal-dependent hydrolase
MRTNNTYHQIALHNMYATDECFIKHIIISKGKIQSINDDGFQSNQKNILDFNFNNALVFPGLINSHDHLDFNLFPQLGNRIYKNYLEWGTDIHFQNKKIITEILNVPKKLRVQWGIYKNLLNGITTVFNHGKQLEIGHSLIDILQDKNSLHSVQLEKNWKWKLNNPFNKKQPYVIHTGEGTDEKSYEEINTLIKWNKLHNKLIGIHGVAMDATQATTFEALIWCPNSNFFLLNATAAIDKLKHATTIMFGTDSAVSASWNIWDQLRIAKQTGLLSNEELFASLTASPAKIRGLFNKGILKKNADADIVIAEKKGNNAMESFYELNPEAILMIIKNGNIILFDESMLPQFLSLKISITMFNRIHINGRFKYVKGEISNLIKQIRNSSKEAVLPVEPA